MRSLLLFLFAIVLWLAACREKDVPSPCEGKVQTTASFAIKEMLGDTAFTADTIFRDNYVQFEALTAYDSVKWKVGNDIGAFTNPRFTLSFVNDLVTIPVVFTGYKQADQHCFPNDGGVYSGTKLLTIVEQVDKATLTLSPLIGRYRGAFLDASSDTFTIRIDYFDSSKYDISVTGTKNFYWISNMPKGYVDESSENARRYPELRNGMPVDMGYKCLLFGWSNANCHSGKAWLSHDSLFVNYGINGCRQQFIGKRL